MIYTELTSTYSFSGDLITMLMCAMFFIMIRESLFFSSDRNFFLFKHATWLLFFGALANILFYHLCNLPVEHVVLIYLFRDVYHVFLLTLLYIFVIYVRNIMGANGRTKSFITVSSTIILVCGMILDCISPLIKFGFYRNADGTWVDSTYFKPYTIAYILTFVQISYLLIFYRKHIVRQIQMILASIEIICIAVLLAQNVFDSNTFTSFTYVIPMVALLVMVHSKPLDLISGAMNADAFESFLESANKDGQKISYMVLQLDLEGEESIPRELGRVLYNFWQTHFRRAVLFNLRQGLYVLAIVKNMNEKTVKDEVENLIFESFPKYYDIFRIGYWIEVLLDVDFIKNKDNFLDAVDYLMNKMHKNDTLFADEKQLETIKLLGDISEEIVDIKNKGDLNDPRILVYCQPVKNVKHDCYDTAEALMRMEIPGIGMVFPDQFIPIAEKMGCIHFLSKIILNKTSGVIKNLMDEGYAVERISVNFSISELKDDNFCSDIIEIIDKHHIPYDKVAIELTESTNDEDYQLLYDKIHELKDYGIHFYLDDFGTGYSNLGRILSLELDIIKFDRSLLISANEDQNIKYTLKHFSQAFEDMDYKILFEGVENEEDEQLCRGCHADYLQGYKFSRPIPIAQLREFLDREE